MSENLLPESINNENINTITKSKNTYNFYNILLNFYYICICGVGLYYLILMNNLLSDFNDKIVLMSHVGKCLFKDICYDFKLGREMCGNCYSNMSFI